MSRKLLGAICGDGDGPLFRSDLPHWVVEA